MVEIMNMPTDFRPRFLSLEFHTYFFPRVLLNRLRPRRRAGSGFYTFDNYVMLAVCLFLVVIATPKPLHHRSIVGWILFGIGLLGLLALLIQSIASQWKERPSYDSFLVGFFFLFITMGLTAGMYFGTHKNSLVLGLLSGSAGLLIGYLLGIFAGLQIQRLGWLAALLNILAGFVTIGLIIFDVVLLFG
jgi:hypothetical protein